MNSRFYFFSFILILGLGCVNSDILPVDYSGYSVNSSVFVIVSTSAGEPIADAVIQIGEDILVTDEFGTCFFQEITMDHRAYMIIEKDGYFHGSRRFYTTEHQIQNIRITLVEHKIVGSFLSSVGGEISIDGSSLSFPVDAVVSNDGATYNGLVDISGYMIYGDDPELSTKMPGTLEGENLDGEQGALCSYGMMIVEMNTPTGQELQVKEGYQVAMRIAVPPSLQSSAPAEVPMWYFDETLGEWQQEGLAIFNGTDYETSVGHFTPWNVDVWAQAITWDAQFVDESGTPLPNLKVCLTNMNTQTTSCSYTDNSGSIVRPIVANEFHELKVIGECNNTLYSKQIGPFSSNASFGTATISFVTGEEEISTVRGIGVNCNDQPVTKGIAIFVVGSTRYLATLNPSDGSFKQNIIVCPTATPNVVVIDQATLLRSQTKYFSYFPDTYLDEIWVCDELDDYISFAFEGFPGTYLFKHPTMQFLTGDQKTKISASDGSPGGMFIDFDFFCQQPGACNVESFEGEISLPNGQKVSFLDFQMGITEYGPVGGAIKCNIFGVVNGGGNGQGGSGFTFFTGSVAVLRTQ